VTSSLLILRSRKKLPRQMLRQRRHSKTAPLLVSTKWVLVSSFSYDTELTIRLNKQGNAGVGEPNTALVQSLLGGGTKLIPPI
jgi:hypothetical protein